MRELTRWLAVAGAIAIALVGCGGGAGSSGASSTALAPDQTQGTTSCGQKDVRIELHDSSCETVETMINLLNGRAKHSVLTLADEFGKVKWVCMKPSHSLYAPLRCASGKRSFAMTFSSH
jgi:hypothetical protein